MKRCKSLRIALYILIAVFLTSHAVCGTFAKYVSSAASGAQSARVAKWGVVVTAGADPLFKTQYTTAGGITVKSVDTNSVIAPGTSGTIAGFSISGTPETACTVSFSGSFALSGAWTYDGDFYCPLIITVGGGSSSDVVLYGLNYSSKADFESAVNNAIATRQENCIANTDLSELNLGMSVSWSWPYRDSTGTVLNQLDEADTYYGVNKATLNNVVSLTLSASVSQID